MSLQDQSPRNGTAAATPQDPVLPVPVGGAGGLPAAGRSGLLMFGLSAFSLALIAGMWLSVEGLIAQEREQRIDEVRRQNANLAHTLKQHAEDSLSQVDALVEAIITRYEAERETLDLPRLYNALRINLSIIHNAAITDDKGMVILSSSPAPQVSLADREHFKVHINNDTEKLYLGNPVLARLTGQWSWPVTRRANNPDGSFLGVVTVLLKPLYFSAFYEQLDLGSSTTISLIGHEGVIRTGMHTGDQILGQNISASPLFQHVDRAPFGSYIAPSQIDQVPRIFAYRRIDGFPLIAEVGTSLKEALEPVARLTQNYRIAAMVATLFMLSAALGLGWLIRGVGRSAQELERLVVERTDSLRQSQQQLIEAQKMEAIGKLTGGMAHDFNNYLGVIIGNLDLIKQKSEGHPELLGLTDAALMGAVSAAELTRSLLSFARRQPLSPQRIDVARRLEAVATLLARTLGEDIVLTTSIAPDIWPVQIDASQLDSSIINLANNARDAMRRGGTLTLSLRNLSIDAATEPKPDIAPGDYILIEVVDTGTGMPPEVLARVFDPFFSTKPVGHGTGLGLSMAQGFIKQSGGHIAIDSTPGVGTHVRLYLPRDTRPADQRTSHAAA